MKLTKRKGFNFFRSYYDVYNELKTDKDKVSFINALLDRQFLGIKPTGLIGLSKFAYISQTNSIDSQVKGYEDKMKISLKEQYINTLDTPTDGGPDGGLAPPSLQVQEKGKEKGKEKEQVQDKSIVSKKQKVFSKPLLDCFNNILNYFPKDLYPKNVKEKMNWLDTLEKLNRIDGWKFEDIEAITYKTRLDSFWQKNFLSITKLRKKDKNNKKYIDVFFNNFRIDLSNDKKPKSREERAREIYEALNN